MSFIVKAEPQFTHAVKVRVPVDGGFEVQTCKATYKVLPTTEAAKYDLSDGPSATEFIQRILVRLDDLKDEEKNPVEYNESVRDQLLPLQYFRTALTRTYFDAIAGAKVGN